MDKHTNQIVAENFVNVTGATLIIDGIEYAPMTGQPIPNKWGGFTSYPVKYWDIIKKLKNDEGKFIPIKDKKGLHILDQEFVPEQDDTIYIVTWKQARLFENARRKDFVIFQSDEGDIDWNNVDHDRQHHTFEGKATKVFYVRQEFVQELILKDTEELPPTTDDIAADQAAFAAQQEVEEEQEEQINGLGNPFQELDSAQFAQEEEEEFKAEAESIIEEAKPKKKTAKKKSSKKVEVC
jgi:hypothetical protein